MSGKKPRGRVKLKKRTVKGNVPVRGGGKRKDGLNEVSGTEKVSTAFLHTGEGEGKIITRGIMKVGKKKHITPLQSPFIQAVDTRGEDTTNSIVSGRGRKNGHNLGNKQRKMIRPPGVRG